MRKNFGPQSAVYPEPVFIIATYDENGHPDAINAAWGGINDTNEIGLCLSAEHKTVKNLLATGAFTVSMGDVAHVIACDYLGITSGNDVPDKLKIAGLSVTKSDFVNAPVINELPMAVECRLKSYDPESGHLVGEIVNVSIEESALTPDGTVDVAKIAPICYDPFHHAYLALGEKVGNAFSDGRKLKKQ